MSVRHNKSIMRRMTSDDLDMVRGWRNHIEVRRYMYTQHEIGADEHLRWFERASTDPRKHLLVFESEREPCGFVSFSLISATVADWGFYLAPDAPKGSGLQLGQAALTYAFHEQAWHKVCGHVL